MLGTRQRPCFSGRASTQRLSRRCLATALWPSPWTSTPMSRRACSVKPRTRWARCSDSQPSREKWRANILPGLEGFNPQSDPQSGACTTMQDDAQTRILNTNHGQPRSHGRVRSPSPAPAFDSYSHSESVQSVAPTRTKLRGGENGGRWPLTFVGVSEKGLAEYPICIRCRRPIVRHASQASVFERMHWSCFHFEFEHSTEDGSGDPDVACG